METNVKNAKISVIVPVYNTPTLHLNRCIDSLLQQDYTNTEMCIRDSNMPLLCIKRCKPLTNMSISTSI